MSKEPTGGALAKRSIRTWLFNPFHYLAGWPALLVGLVAMLAAGALASSAGARFDGTLDFHQLPSGVESAGGSFLLDAAAAWLPLSCLLWLGGRLVSKSRFRTVDVFGTQALARLPALLMALASLPPGVRRYSQHLLNVAAETLKQFGETTGQNMVAVGPAEASTLDAVAFFACMAVVLVGVVWMVALMYRAFAVSCNVRGGRAVGVFVVALILAEVASKLIIASAL